MLSQRLGYPVRPGNRIVSRVATAPIQLRAVFSRSIRRPALRIFPSPPGPQPANGILPYIPAPTLPGTVNNYTDNSQTNTWNDDKYGLKIDFINKTDRKLVVVLHDRQCHR